ncbi:MAG: FAD-dependent oxidoreductase [Rubrivivax sp.]|nr:FAD-dependent oxidoreductase [Rubrivivax sp.]
MVHHVPPPPGSVTRSPDLPGGPRIAVVGAGVAGLAAAWTLSRQVDAAVTLFEREPHFGGHAHTVDVTLLDTSGRLVTHGVDTGFLVYNLRTYPQLIELFRTLGVETAASDMSFSVQAPDGLDGRSRRLEWSGASLASVFAQRRNLLSPAFLGMLRDILRFNRFASSIAARGADARLEEPLADFLLRHRFGGPFVHGYLLPMIGSIWSCPTDQMLRFPVGTLIRFCHNHGLLQVEGRPPWRTVRGGSRRYVEAMLKRIPDARQGTAVLQLRRRPEGVFVTTEAGTERFDAVVLACHAPQALSLLGPEASVAERQVLGPLRTRANLAVLHTDASLMPRLPRAWAAWNYERAGGAGAAPEAVCLHYWLNRLQPLPFAKPLLVSLNPLRPPREDLVLGRYHYAHPVFDLDAVRAQRRLIEIQGQDRVWFCGAWCGYGFHEDGLKAGLAAAQGVRAWLARTGFDASGGQPAPPGLAPAAEVPPPMTQPSPA